MSYKFNPFTGNLDEVSSVTALNVKGTVADSTALNALTGMAVGDVYQQEDNDVFYVYDGANWDSLGTLVGPQGATGPAGPTGAAGADGADGADGANGTGVAAGGTDGQVLTKSGSSDYNTTWTTISTGGLGNIVEDTTPQLGGTLESNGNNIQMGDNDELRFGANNDFKIFHDPNDCRFENTNGDIKFKNTGDYFFFDENGVETLASFINDGAVNLYNNGSKKFETTSTGIDVTGHVEADTLNVSGATTFQSNVDFSDSIRLRVGDGNDLQIYHDGTDSYIEDTGTGSLVFKGSFFKFRDTSNNNIFQAGSGYLYLLKPLSTFDAGDIELDPDGAGVVTFKGNATKGSGQFKLNCEQNSHGVTVKGPPHSAAASYTLTLPNDTGTNGQALLTNGSGVTSWGTVAVTGTAQTFTAAQRGTITTLTSGATVTPDFAASNNYSLTLDQNLTIANPTNLTAGQSGSIFLVQDGTGSRTASWGSYWDFAGGTAPTLTTTASAVDRIDYVVRSSTSIHAVATLNYS